MRRTSQLALVILHVCGFTLACAGPELDSAATVAIEDSAPPLLPQAPECPSWAGLAQAGATRTWEFQGCSDEATGGWTSRITGVTVNDGWRSVTVREEGAEGRETTSYSKTWVANLEYRCDDEGVWFIGSEESATYSASGAPSYTSKHTLVLDAPALLLPSSPSPSPASGGAVRGSAGEGGAVSADATKAP